MAPSPQSDGPTSLHQTSTATPAAIPPHALKEAILQTVTREGTINLDGALKAIEFSQSFNLSYFSTPQGVEQAGKSYAASTADMQAFLQNAAASLTGLCHLYWGQRGAWIDLAGSLIVHPVNFERSLFDKATLLQFRGDKNYTDQDIVELLASTPPLAFILLLRWLRTDLQEAVYPQLHSLYQSRPPQPAS